jgi:16S rRNA processing protein RimM
MSTPEGLLQVGRVGRPHGIKGDLFLDLTTDRHERAAVDARLLIAGKWYVVERSARSNDRWRVHLTGVESREQAQALTGKAMFAEPIDDPDVLWIHDLVGASVVDSDGVDRGRCVAVIDNPAADLLELEGGALVPINFVTEVTGRGTGATVVVDVPEGLFELYEPER